MFDIRAQGELGVCMSKPNFCVPKGQGVKRIRDHLGQDMYRQTSQIEQFHALKNVRCLLFCRANQKLRCFFYKREKEVLHFEVWSRRRERRWEFVCMGF
jgi:hypothetical protein